MFIKLFIENLAAMTYHKSLRIEMKLEVFFFRTKKKRIFFFLIFNSECFKFFGHF
jgi:hypothetical protein